MRILEMADHGVPTYSRRARVDAIVQAIDPIAVLGKPEGLEITGVVFDDREVTFGSLFCCIVGGNHDGHDYVARARSQGALAFICEHSLSDVGNAVQLVVPPGGARHAMALASRAFYGDPTSGLRLVGVTGTNGKTTTTYLLRSIFEAASLTAGVIGTLDGARTTPEAPYLYRTLSDQRDHGVRAVAMEVSSHALVQHRVDGLVFDVAVFTNLTRDHLDYHGSMEEYFAAKSVLFGPDHAKMAVVNADDPYGRRLLERPSIPTVGFSLSDVTDLRPGITESHFRLGGRAVRLGIGGEFNVRNAIGAAAAATALGLAPEVIVRGLEQMPGVPGRFETFTDDAGVTAVVDFAHTPAGLDEVLRSARQVLVTRSERGGPPGRLVVVFGCGGERDRGKRPAMGAIASRLADAIVLTSDNPRSESPLAIIEEIRAGATGATPLTVEPNRREAIARALRDARRGDVVVVAGKGHETTQEFSNGVEHFDDREVVAREIERLGRKLAHP
jgi:UDP-N-acetylmuramoyl-L-alanyl-D-glutamate--2,6-diaminopimelate ligase